MHLVKSVQVHFKHNGDLLRCMFCHLDTFRSADFVPRAILGIFFDVVLMLSRNDGDDDDYLNVFYDARKD